MAEQEAVLEFARNVLEDLAYSLGVLACKQTDKAKMKAIEACGDVIRLWLSTNAKKIRCSRSPSSWEWLRDRAGEAGEKTAAKLIELKLEQWKIQQEAAGERRAFGNRTAAAMEEYRQGGGE